jgi:hypothetical protein
MWWILLAAAFFALFFLGRGGPNAIGGTATLGTLIGVGIAFYQQFGIRHQCTQQADCRVAITALNVGLQPV